MGSGLALAISQASHFLQPPPQQSIIIERMHSGMACSNVLYSPLNWCLKISVYLSVIFRKVWSLWFPLFFPHRSSSLRHTRLWPSCSADWRADPNLWRLGLSIHRHLDTGGGGGWPQASGCHRHQHPLPHSTRPAAATGLQVHEGLNSVCIWIWIVEPDVFEFLGLLLVHQNHLFLFVSQITVIGRYGSTNARAKIPLGFYYGHTYILPWESELKLMHDPLRGESEAASQPDVDQHLTMMMALQEDIQCR